MASGILFKDAVPRYEKLFFKEINVVCCVGRVA